MQHAVPDLTNEGTMLRLLAPCIFALVLTLQVEAQSAPPVVLAGTQQYDLTSTVNGRVYRLHVAPPDGYLTGDTTRYPVLYLLDGHFAFPAAVAARAYMGVLGELEDVIIVGISEGDYSFNAWFADRWRDYTPSANPAADSSFARQYKVAAEAVRSGGGPDFLRVLRADILPFVDTAYRTTEDRGLSGHSLGGLFTTYALFTAPDLFQRYGINSPSLWWNGSEMFAVESAFAATHKALPKRLLLTVGANEGGSMVPPMVRLASLLQSRGYEGLVMGTVVFQDETHLSVGPAMIARTLRVLYGKQR
jgi:predicted alpha/beta superfamily hydrolase